MEKTKKTYTKPELERVKFNFKAQLQAQSEYKKDENCYNSGFKCYGFDYRYM